MPESWVIARGGGGVKVGNNLFYWNYLMNCGSKIFSNIVPFSNSFPNPTCFPFIIHWRSIQSQSLNSFPNVHFLFHKCFFLFLLANYPYTDFWNSFHIPIPVSFVPISFRTPGWDSLLLANLSSPVSSLLGWLANLIWI